MALRKLEPDEKELMRKSISELNEALNETLNDDAEIYSYDWQQLYFEVNKLKRQCQNAIERSKPIKEKI